MSMQFTKRENTIYNMNNLISSRFVNIKCLNIKIVVYADIIETPEKLDSYPASKRALLRRLLTRHRHYVNFCTILTCLIFCSQTWEQHIIQVSSNVLSV